MNQNDQTYGYGAHQQGPYHAGGPITPLPKPPKRKRPGRVVAIVVGICLAGIVLIGGCTALMFDGAIDAGKADSAPQVQPTASEPGTPVPSPTTKPKSKEVAPTYLPRDGVLFVGKDVKAGTYRTMVPADSFGCYAARLKDTDGGINSIISNNLYEPGAQAVLTVKRTDYAIEVRCDGAKWERVK